MWSVCSLGIAGGGAAMKNEFMDELNATRVVHANVSTTVSEGAQLAIKRKS